MIDNYNLTTLCVYAWFKVLYDLLSGCLKILVSLSNRYQIVISDIGQNQHRWYRHNTNANVLLKWNHRNCREWTKSHSEKFEKRYTRKHPVITFKHTNIPMNTHTNTHANVHTNMHTNIPLQVRSLASSLLFLVEELVLILPLLLLVLI